MYIYIYIYTYIYIYIYICIYIYIYHWPHNLVWLLGYYSYSISLIGIA